MKSIWHVATIHVVIVCLLGGCVAEREAGLQETLRWSEVAGEDGVVYVATSVYYDTPPWRSLNLWRLSSPDATLPKDWTAQQVGFGLRDFIISDKKDIYFNDMHDVVYRVRSNDGAVVMRAQLPRDVRRLLALGHSHLYMASRDAQLLAIDIVSGDITVAYEARGISERYDHTALVGPITSGNYVIAYMKADAELVALRDEKGWPLGWRKKIPGENIRSISSIGSRFLIFDAESVQCMSSEDHTLLWSMPLSCPSLVSHTGATDDRYCYVISNSEKCNKSSQLVALDSATGEVIFRYDAGLKRGAPVCIDDRVVSTDEWLLLLQASLGSSKDYDLVAVSRADGKRLWAKSLGVDRVGCGPQVIWSDGQRIMVAAYEKLFVWDKEGQLKTVLADELK